MTNWDIGRRWALVRFLLESPRAIKFQIMLFIGFARMHHPYDSYYRRLYGFEPPADDHNRANHHDQDGGKRTSLNSEPSRRTMSGAERSTSGYGRDVNYVTGGEQEAAGGGGGGGGDDDDDDDSDSELFEGLDIEQLSTRLKGERQPPVVRELLSKHIEQEEKERKRPGGKRVDYRKLNVFELTPEASEWDWRGQPHKWLVLRLYDVVSTSWMIYAAIRTIFGDQGIYSLIDMLLQGLTSIPAHCLLMGRFVLHPTVDHIGPTLFAAYHIVWRSAQRFLERRYQFGMLTFLLQSEHDLDKFQALMEANQRSSYLVPGASLPPLKPAAAKATTLSEYDLWVARASKRPSVVTAAGLRHFNTAGATTASTTASLQRRYNGLYQHLVETCRRDQELPGQERASTSAGGSPAIGVHEHFMRHLMCYEIFHEGRLIYRLRPNRTRQARKQLSQKLVGATLVSTISFISLALPITLAIVLLILSDFRYASIYPGCDVDLNRRLMERKLSFWSWTLSGHHLLSAAFDSMENIILWADSGIGVTFVVSLAHLIDSDILLYWRHLHKRLELANELVKRQFVIRSQLYPDNDEDEAHVDYEHEANGGNGVQKMCNLMPELKLNAQRSSVKRFGRHNDANNNNDRVYKKMLHDLQAECSAEIYEIQYEIYDFFHQVEQADLVVSDILTASILCWLMSCVFLSYYFLAKTDQELPLIVKCIQLFGVLVITMATKRLLTLHKCCMRSHQLICSLMAHEQTAQTKRRFINVLEFFTERNRTTYTLFQHHPYLATTFITIIGWSFSCFFIAHALFGRDKVRTSSIFGKHKYLDF